jgi:hypothetical protein
VGFQRRIEFGGNLREGHFGNQLEGLNSKFLSGSTACMWCSKKDKALGRLVNAVRIIKFRDDSLGSLDEGLYFA